MTPERALEHDERCEREDPVDWDSCRCAERALAAARQREEEAKGRLAQCEASWHQLDAACQVRFDEYRAEVRQKSDMIAALTESNSALRAEITRLTLAASESARTLQVEIEQMKAESVCWETGHTAEMGARLLRVHCPMCTDAAIKTIQQERDALKAQVTALREALANVMRLVDEGRLVRNTTNDGHMPTYLAESVQLVKALANAQELLASLPQDGAHDGGEGSKKP